MGSGTTSSAHRIPDRSKIVVRMPKVAREGSKESKGQYGSGGVVLRSLPLMSTPQHTPPASNTQDKEFTSRPLSVVTLVNELDDEGEGWASLDPDQQSPPHSDVATSLLSDVSSQGSISTASETPSHSQGLGKGDTKTSPPLLNVTPVEENVVSHNRQEHLTPGVPSASSDSAVLSNGGHGEDWNLVELSKLSGDRSKASSSSSSGLESVETDLEQYSDDFASESESDV